jgi:phosphoenolpyruvate synthase/pyruvate phosphate dikinase
MSVALSIGVQQMVRSDPAGSGVMFSPRRYMKLK